MGGLQSIIELTEALQDSQGCMHRPQDIVLMRPRIAEIDQEAIAEVLGNVSLKALDDRRTGGVVGTDDIYIVFRVYPTRQDG
jgi:hypothetical protein